MKQKYNELLEISSTKTTAERNERLNHEEQETDTF